jgi:L,D-transpeptidase YcbB
MAIAAIVPLALIGTGCRGGLQELRTLRTEAIGRMLAGIGADSTVHLSSGDTLQISAETMEFYGRRKAKAAWVGAKGPLPRGAALLDAIGHSGDDGLPSERYRYDVAVATLARTQEDGDHELTDSLSVLYLADLDLLLTEGFNRLARDLVVGMMSPTEAGLDYKIVAEAPPPSTILDRVIAKERPADIVAELRPSMPQYERMRAALAAFQRGEARGDLDGLATMNPEGVVGDSVGQLKYTSDQAIAELRLNLDRWRWLPNDLGDRYVLVNIAGYEMEVVDQRKVIESMDVVVGTRDTKTPLFADSIEYVVVNPYWNVPDGIMERKIRPGIAADRNYLAKHDMEVFEGRVRQRPGPTNSLGRFKFLFPNDYDVYLHDTPEGELFNREERAFSSGCVRLARPRDFANLLLTMQSSQDPATLDATIDAALAAKTEKWIKLDRPLPVYILYFTAWALEDGTVSFHHDVYGRDAAMDGQAEEMKTPER